MSKRALIPILLVAFTLIACTRPRRASPQPSVESITTITEYGKSLDWSHTTDLIAFGKRGEDGYYDVYVMRPDGSSETCLTCGNPDVPKHNGNPAWHPSGEYIAFTAEKAENPAEDDEFAIPGTGIHCDLWVMTDDGGHLYRLTDLPWRPAQGVIHPQFSHDGTMLLWTERVSPGGGLPWGEWALKLADFVVGADGPRIENIRTYQPGDQHNFYESHAFSNDDSRILFSANSIPGQSPTGIDIYEMDLATQELTRLTATLEDWDEHAHYSPDGTRIAWMSSTGFDITYTSIEKHEWARELITELWIMDADGSNPQRLTYFNEPDHAEYTGHPVIVSDSAWSPDGNRLAVLMAYRTASGLRTRIVMITLRAGM
ncbi:MAG: TolB family protein [Anaerolineae bacterium]